MGFGGCGVRCFRRGVESAREAGGESRVRFERASSDDWAHWIGGIGRGPFHGSTGPGCKLRAAVGRGNFLEGKDEGWRLKPGASALKQRFVRFAPGTQRQ